MGSLTVHVLNDDGDPVRGKRVFVNFVGSFLGVADTHLEDYTDSDGTVDFDDIPTGKVAVYVDGDLQVTVSVGQNDHEDVTVSL
jgi:uncharacterized GH25 family protein